MALCMAALSKLAYCNLPPDSAKVALEESCGMPCEWAGMELEPGSRLLGQSASKGQQLDFGFIAKFKRGEETNKESMPARGCIVALHAPEQEDDEDAKFDIGAIASPTPVVDAGGTPVVPRATLSVDADASSKHRLEVWESDAVCKGCKVSAAYKAAWDSLRPRILDHLMDAGCKPGDAVFVTGHSKGAALATLAMFSLQAQAGYHVQLSYNFESPRVGNKAFATAFNQIFNLPVALFRITHGLDQVTREPRKELGYLHGGHQVWYKKDSASADFIVCGNATEDPSCGVDSMPWNQTCPLEATKACVNQTCAEFCKEDAPEGGPHCQHPLAPAQSFCDFAGNNTENWGSEWNEVVKREGETDAWEKSCAWGKTIAKPPPSKGDQAAVEKAEREAKAAKDALDSKATSTHKPSRSKDDSDGADKAGKKNNGTCFKSDVTYQPLDMVGHYFSTESDAWACQTRCAGIDGCAHWSFFRRGTNGDCHVTGKDAYQQPGSVGFVSGPRSCEDPTKDRQYVQFLGGFPSSGPKSGPYWYFPGLAAAGALAIYFILMSGLALSTWRSAPLGTSWAYMIWRPSEARGAAPSLTDRSAAAGAMSQETAEVTMPMLRHSSAGDNVPMGVDDGGPNAL